MELRIPLEIKPFYENFVLRKFVAIRYSTTVVPLHMATAKDDLKYIVSIIINLYTSHLSYGCSDHKHSLAILSRCLRQQRREYLIKPPYKFTVKDLTYTHDNFIHNHIM